MQKELKTFYYNQYTIFQDFQCLQKLNTPDHILANSRIFFNIGPFIIFECNKQIVVALHDLMLCEIKIINSENVVRIVQYWNAGAQIFGIAKFADGCLYLFKLIVHDQFSLEIDQIRRVSGPGFAYFDGNLYFKDQFSPNLVVLRVADMKVVNRNGVPFTQIAVYNQKTIFSASSNEIFELSADFAQGAKVDHLKGLMNVSQYYFQSSFQGKTSVLFANSEKILPNFDLDFRVFGKFGVASKNLLIYLELVQQKEFGQYYPLEAEFVEKIGRFSKNIIENKTPYLIESYIGRSTWLLQHVKNYLNYGVKGQLRVFDYLHFVMKMKIPVREVDELKQYQFKVTQLECFSSFNLI